MDLNFKKIGESSKKIIILHGLFGSLDNWMTHARELSNNGFEVYLIDQRNHGKSPHDKGFSYELMAEDLYHFIIKHSLQNSILIGHSLGGKTVMQFVMQFNISISKVIVVDIAPKQYTPYNQKNIDAFLAVDIENLKSRKEAHQKMSSVLNDVNVIQFLLKNLERVSDGFTWKLNLHEIIRNIENVDKIYPFQKACMLPTLFIRGSKSDYILDEDRNLLKMQFPNSTLVTIEKAGHWLHSERYEEFMKALFLFLNR